MGNIITLTSDFGYEDYFVGAMKGVILRINPEAKLIDLSHEIEPQNLEAAAYIIKSCYPYFPPGTIHLVVVDPGVGGFRRPILILTENAYFVGPDNGVFSYIYSEHTNTRVIQITAREYFLKPEWCPADTWAGGIGSTFHGRDVFAPIAAWLSKGVDPEKFGKEIHDAVQLPLAGPVLTESSGKRLLAGRIIYIDRYGNLISNLTKTHLDKLAKSAPKGKFHLQFRKKPLEMKQFYAEGTAGQSYALINSCGHIEIFVYLGNAQDNLRASIGDPVLLELV